MVTRTPQNANDFIEQQLDQCIDSIATTYQSDALSFSGGLVFGVDDLVRNVVEEMRHGSQNRKLVVILTTTGGYIEVVQRIVETLRHHYNHVEFIIPNYAYSAGTVLVMSGNAIHMNYYSRLGPVDPQVEINGQMLPALGYLIQWERLIKKSGGTSGLTTAEAQLLIDGFDQAELYKYEQARELSIALLKDRLVKYKFKNWTVTKTRGVPVTHAMRVQRAASIARMLNKTEKWHSHGYGISSDVLRKDVKLEIEDFDSNPVVGKKIRGYYNLLDDYMTKLGNMGVVHTKGRHIPFAMGER